MNKKKKKIIMGIFLGIVAVAFAVIAAYLLWWYGFFLPRWIKWENAMEDFCEVQVTLKGRRLTVRDGEGNVTWKTQGDWFVQDLVVKDLDRDGEDEMILLVWKHGSYGKHMPFWVKKNDKNLKQHIFIYKYDARREEKVRPIWMSSQIEYEIESISSGEKSFLNVTDHSGNTRIWVWRDFGLKLVR